jgi:hypothetical protein
MITGASGTLVNYIKRTNRYKHVRPGESDLIRGGFTCAKSRATGFAGYCQPVSLPAFCQSKMIPINYIIFQDIINAIKFVALILGTCFIFNAVRKFAEVIDRHYPSKFEVSDERPQLEERSDEDGITYYHRPLR